MVRYLTAGDKGLVVEFGKVISPEINAKVISFREAVLRENITGIVETFPSYASLTVIYEPQVISHGTLILALQEIEKNIQNKSHKGPRFFEIPVHYGGEHGPDIAYVAEVSGLSVDEVIKLHSSKPYLIYMLGFMPGFAFLGGLDERLRVPRLATPRLKVREGSVGIAGIQTGVYAIESPGGWQLIGRTPEKLFDPNRSEPVRFRAGDYVQFVPVS